MTIPKDDRQGKIDNIELTEGEYKLLRILRGGCSCHLNPPCSNCSDPLTVSEGIELGIIDENGNKIGA